MGLRLSPAEEIDGGNTSLLADGHRDSGMILYPARRRRIRMRSLGNLFLFSEMNMGTTSKVFPNRVQSGKRVVAMGGSLAVTVRTQRDYIFPT